MLIKIIIETNFSHICGVLTIDGHLVRYPWSAISDWAWYRNFRYRTERVESNILSNNRNKCVSYIGYPTSLRNRQSQKLSVIVLAYCSKVRGFESAGRNNFVSSMSRISEWTRMSISEHFRYRNDVFQCDIFVTDIGITEVDVGYRISPTLRSMLMPTYGINAFKS
jgi:hypothetical protein